METCGFRKPGSDLYNGEYPKEVAKATEIWRDTWILPLLDALLGNTKGMGFINRQHALKSLSEDEIIE